MLHKTAWDESYYRLCLSLPMYPSGKLRDTTQLHTARELGETLLRLAQRARAPSLFVIAHYALGVPCVWLGALPTARLHLEASLARYTPDQRCVPVYRMGVDPGVGCCSCNAMVLWLLGYPAQALARIHEALALAQELSHLHSLA